MKTKIGLVQSRCGSDKQNNLKRTLNGIADAAGRGARIVCLQELFLTQYFCQEEDSARFSLAEEIPGPTTTRLSEAAKAHDCVIIASLFEKRAPGIYHNTAAVIDADGSYLGKYRKMHIPDDPNYYEKFYFTPGDLGYRTWDTRHGKIGVLVCWDQWYPEAARLTALSGARILFYPTAIGWMDEEKEAQGAAQQTAWETVQRGHAVANGCYVAAVNRTGREGALDFWGGSFVANPFGEVVAKAAADKEEVLVVECDLGRIEEIRCDWPFFRDRRIDTYADLQKRYLD